MQDLEIRLATTDRVREHVIADFTNPSSDTVWRLPRMVALSEYGLGKTGNEREEHDVAEFLGATELEWQRSQDPEESWRECRLHTRNLLGRPKYLELIETLSDQSSDAALETTIDEFRAKEQSTDQGQLF
jgi:hypothetical protein